MQRGAGDQGLAINWIEGRVRAGIADEQKITQAERISLVGRFRRFSDTSNRHERGCVSYKQRKARIPCSCFSLSTYCRRSRTAKGQTDMNKKFRRGNCPCCMLDNFLYCALRLVPCAMGNVRSRGRPSKFQSETRCFVIVDNDQTNRGAGKKTEYVT